MTWGGGGDATASPPHTVDKWINIGPRPAYGLFLRNCVGVTVEGLRLSSEHAEGRPAFVLQNASNVKVRFHRDGLNRATWPSIPITWHSQG